LIKIIHLNVRSRGRTRPSRFRARTSCTWRSPSRAAARSSPTWWN